MTTETRWLSGRKRELRELRELLAVPQSAVIVSGEPGSGRSAMLEAVRSRSTIRTAQAAPHPSERERPFAGVSVILNAMGDPRIAEFVGRFVLLDDSIDGTFAAASDLLVLLRGNPAEETLVIIDDADCFDIQTQFALAFMASRLTGTGLSILASVSPESAASVFAGIPRVELPDLDSVSALAMARSRKPDADEQVLALLADSSGGRPGILANALDSLSSDQLHGVAALPLPLLPARLATGLHALHPETVQLLQRISSARVNSTSAVNTNRLLFEELTSTGVLEVLGPFVAIRDQAMRSSLYWSMTPAERESAHRQAAVQESGLQAGLAAWHLDHIEQGSEEPTTLIAQSVGLFELGMRQAGVELVERGIMLSADSETTTDALLDLCERLLSLPEDSTAQRYLRIARAMARSPKAIIRAEKLEFIRQSLLDDQINIGAVALHARRFALEDPESSADLLALVSARLVVGFDMVGARALASEALETLNRSDSGESSTIQHWATRLINAMDGEDAALPVPVAKESPDLDALELPARLVSGRALSYEEKYDEARRVLAPLESLIQGSDRISGWAASAATVAAENEIRAGRVREAVAIIDSVEARDAPRSQRNILLLGWRALTMGNFDDVEPLVDELRTMTKGSSSVVARAQRQAFEGAHAMFLGDFDRAAERLGKAYGRTIGLRPGILRVEGDLVESLAFSGDASGAQSVTDTLASRHSRNPSEWSRVALARARAIVAPENRVDQEFDRAVESALGIDSQLEAARIRLSYSRTLERLGEHGRAREVRELAAHGLQGLGATGLVRAVSIEVGLGAAEPQHFLLSTLTESELAVLRLMHRGVRNKDIAAALFVSLRTVEVRITQIYRKLEARSRSHLLTLVGADIDEDPDFISKIP